MIFNCHQCSLLNCPWICCASKKLYIYCTWIDLFLFSWYWFVCFYCISIYYLLVYPLERVVTLLFFFKSEFFLPLNVLSIIMEKWHQRKWILKVYRQKIVRWPTCKTIYLSCFLSFFFFFFCLNSHIFLHCMSWLFTFSPIIIRML